jgi:GT2 family glycosyltransferase
LQLRLLTRQTNGGPAAARNDGWRATEASVVAFTDDDCVPVPEWLETGLTRLKRDGGIVVGRTAPAPDQQHLLAPFTRTVVVDDTRFLQCCNVFYCRDDLLANGGFDERLRTGEDTDLGLRVLESGRVAHFEPAALVHHDVRSADLRATLRESAAWVDLPLVVRKHPGLRTTHLHRRIFWKRSHPPVLAAFAGIALAATGRRALGVGLLFPWLWHRTRTAPVPARALAGTLAVDAVEVATMVRGSLRHGTLVL